LRTDSRQISLPVENVRRFWYNQTVVCLNNPDEYLSRNSSVTDLLANGGTKIFNVNYTRLKAYAFYGFENTPKEFIRCSKRKAKPAQDMADTLKTYKLAL
jgi:hypothetical protein